MSRDEINGLITKWMKRHGFVLFGFLGFGGYETYESYTNKQVEEAIRHKYVDELIEMIHEDRAIENIQDKNRQQDERLDEIETILLEY